MQQSVSDELRREALTMQRPGDGAMKAEARVLDMVDSIEARLRSLSVHLSV